MKKNGQTRNKVKNSDTLNEDNLQGGKELFYFLKFKNVFLLKHLHFSERETVWEVPIKSYIHNVLGKNPFTS